MTTTFFSSSRYTIELLIYVLDTNGDLSKIDEYAEQLKYGFRRVIDIETITINRQSSEYIYDSSKDTLNLAAYSKPLFDQRTAKSTLVYLSDIELWLNDEYSAIFFKENKLQTDCYFIYKVIHCGFWNLIAKFLPYPDRYLETPERVIRIITESAPAAKKKKRCLVSNKIEFNRIVDTKAQAPLFNIEYL